MTDQPRPNRRARRAEGKTAAKGKNLFAPAECPQCQAFVEAHPRIRDTCAEVGIEAGILPQVALTLFLNGFHDNNHSEEVTAEAAAEAESPEAKSTFN